MTQEQKRKARLLARRFNKSTSVKDVTPATLKYTNGLHPNYYCFRSKFK